MTVPGTTVNRRTFLARAAAAGAFASFHASATPPAIVGLARKPDILFLLADDYAFNLVHALGCNEIQTPNLDRLVNNGVSFTNCYNPGGWHGAVCVASRTMLMTGLFLWQAKAAEKKLEELSTARRLWPHYLCDAGYKTFFSGKWHVNCRPEAVFERTAHIRPGMPPDIPAQYNRPLPESEDPFTPADPASGGHFSGGRHWSEVVADDGIRFLREAAEKPAPFFLYLAFNAPHDPRQSPRACLDLYDPKALPLPRNFLPEYPLKDAIGCGPGLRDERLAPFPRTEDAVRTHRREYYAAITHLDIQIGRILDALKHSGRMDNTLVFFTADNGLAAGCHGLMGKQNMFEHSMKVPLVISGPGILSGRQLHDLVYMQEAMSTTLDLAGIPASAQASFKSLQPLLQGTPNAGRETIYGAYMDLQRMIRVNNHKLIYYPRLDRALLFDLDADPDELHDLSGETSAASTLAELHHSLNHMQKTTEDPLVFS